jgi:hypothetical protein
MMRIKPPLMICLMVIVLCGSYVGASRDAALGGPRQGGTTQAADLNDLGTPQSELRGMIDRYTVDRGTLNRSYSTEMSPTREVRLKQLYTEWLTALERQNFDALSQAGKVDYVLFKNHLTHELLQLEIESQTRAEIAPLLPFSKSITDLADARRRMEQIDSSKAAALLTSLKKQVDTTRRAVEMSLKGDARGESGPEGNGDAKASPIKVKKTVANRAVAALNSLRNSLRGWFGYYNGYDPTFTWWVDEPYKALDQALQTYAVFLGERVVGLRMSEAPAPDVRAGPGPERNRGAGGQAPERGRTTGARAGDSRTPI